MFLTKYYHHYKTCKRIQALEEKGIKAVNIGSQKEKSFKEKKL